MKSSVFKVTSAFFLDETRDLGSAIWVYAFPVLLLTILVSIFSNVGRPEKMRLDVGLVRPRTVGLGSQMLVRSLEEISKQENGIVALHRYESLEDAVEAMKRRRVVAVIEIPDDFDLRFTQALLRRRTGSEFEPATLDVHTLSGKEISKIAVQVIRSITNAVFEAIEAGRGAMTLEYELVTSSEETFRYVDWIIPGIVLMALMTVGLFGVGSSLVYLKEKGTLKRLQTTPLTSVELTLGFLGSRGFIMAIQTVIIWFYSVWVLGASGRIFSWRFFLWTAFAGVVITSMGMAIASFAKTSEAATTVSNVLNWLLMFLSGLYFPVFNAPWAVRWITYASPITYLAEGYRRFNGLSLAPYPSYLNILVPSLWTAFFLTIAVTRFRWSEET